MAASAVEKHAAGARLFARVWAYLLVITAAEVLLAYVHALPPLGMLIVLMCLSLVKAGLIVTYFMHLRFERASLVFSLIPAVVLVIALLFMFFPDGFRAYDLRVR
jgi:cytochrome c oxidase subunit IV